MIDSTEINSNQVEENMISSVGAYNANSTINSGGNVSSNEASYHLKSSQYYQSKVEDEDILESDVSSDEDVLHVVTNVYTIPIVKSSSAGNGPFIQASQLHTTTSVNEDLISRYNNLIQDSTSVQTEPGIDTKSSQSRIITKLIDSKQHGSSSSLLNDKTQKIINSLPPTGNENVVKSKFQIRSIVEIYENQGDLKSQHDECTVTSNTSNTEILKKEIYNDIVKKGKSKFEKKKRHKVV